MGEGGMFLLLFEICIEDRGRLASETASSFKAEKKKKEQE